MHKTIKRTPKGPWITFKSLKTRTNRMKNEEQLRSQFDSGLASFSLLSLQSFTFGPENHPLSPSSCLFIAKQGIWGHDSLPRRAGYFTMKLFRFRKCLKMTILPSSFGIFTSLITTLNDHLFRTILAFNITSRLARIKRSSNDSPLTKLRYDTYVQWSSFITNRM